MDETNAAREHTVSTFTLFAQEPDDSQKHPDPNETEPKPAMLHPRVFRDATGALRLMSSE